MAARVATNAYKPFTTSLACEQKISLMKMFKPEFPAVKKMTITNSFHWEQGGMRYFTANFMPSVKYYNQHIEYQFVKKRALSSDATTKACGIEVTFDDGTTHYINAENLEHQAIWKKLIQEARGVDNSNLPPRPSPPTLEPPTLEKKSL